MTGVGGLEGIGGQGQAWVPGMRVGVAGEVAPVALPAGEGVGVAADGVVPARVEAGHAVGAFGLVTLVGCGHRKQVQLFSHRYLSAHVGGWCG